MMKYLVHTKRGLKKQWDDHITRLSRSHTIIKQPPERGGHVLKVVRTVGLVRWCWKCAKIWDEAFTYSGFVKKWMFTYSHFLILVRTISSRTVILLRTEYTRTFVILRSEEWGLNYHKFILHILCSYFIRLCLFSEEFMQSTLPVSYD